MASFDVAKLLNKITQDIPGIKTVLTALAKWDLSALTDVPDGAMQATTDSSNRLTIKKKVSGSYANVGQLQHSADMVDGYHASTSATANTVAVRNAQGALPGNVLGNAATANTATALASGSVLPVNQGGTGGNTASAARNNLGVAGGADFTAHVLTAASPSVTGHVALDALAADGSATAAPGGFGLGTGTMPRLTDLDLATKTGHWGFASTAQNLPAAAWGFLTTLSLNNTGKIQDAITAEANPLRFSRSMDNSVWQPWKPMPNGITDLTDLTSSTIAASATAVKSAHDRGTAGVSAAATAQATANAAKTVTDKVTPIPKAHAVPQADANGLLADGWLLRAVPTGFSGFYAGGTPPDGWLEENGAWVSRTAYAKLFAVIGTAYGAGDGSTTFTLPDSRGLVKRALDNGRGLDPGRTRGSYQADAARQQEGYFRYDTTTIDSVGGICSQVFSGGGGWIHRTGDNGNSREIKISFGSANETRMKNLSYMGIIKY